MIFARFCAIFLRKTGNIFCESCVWNEILVLRNFVEQFAQNRKFYAKCNFLGTLSTIDILSLEFKNLKIYFKHKKTYEYENDYTTLNWLPVTSSYTKLN